jgi:hypothetical protein
MSILSRRGFLKAAAGVAGAAVGTRFGGPRWLREAEAANERSVLVALYLNGGYNALFSSADSFIDTAFSVTSDNILPIGNGLFVDKSTLGSMSQYAREHMASIGLAHGITDHYQAHVANWTSGSRSYALQLAAAMGGTGPIKAPLLGYGLDGLMDPPAEGSVSLQRIDDLAPTLAALGSAKPDPRVPSRSIAAAGLSAAETMSKDRLAQNPESLGQVKDGFTTVIDTLKQPPRQIVYSEIAAAYGMGATDTYIPSFSLREKMAGAELMALAGANVVTVVDYGAKDGNGWDTHQSGPAALRERAQMEQELMPLLNTFASRMLNQPDLNVVIALFGDFARDVNNDHGVNQTATVIGKYVKVGTTGKTNAQALLPAGTPGPQQFWAYLAKVLKVPTEPFGANPHPLVL